MTSYSSRPISETKAADYGSCRPETHLDGYATTFTQVDWGTLYEQHEGFLLFEDLKEQWKTFIQPDYVLVDSRTGAHTDIGGICTRQLPDAVGHAFLPECPESSRLEKSCS